jgi:hypothetical protein
MKRTREEHPYLVKGDAQPTAAATKRPKSTQACSSCRRQKTRCENLNSGPSGSLRCHRCSVLNIHCSFDDLSSVKDSPSTPTVDLTRQDSPPLLSAGLIQPEDLVPLPTSRFWGSLKSSGGLDWTAAPMLALQDLARRPIALNHPVTDYSNMSLADIVPPDQRHFLLET